MDYNCKPRSILSVTNDISKGKYNFHHPLQRKEGQWSIEQKSKLIRAILKKYRIDPIDVAVDGKTLYIIDGVQRMSTIRDFVDNKFALWKFLKPVEVDGEIIDLAGKKFEDLEESVKNAFTACDIQVSEMREYTDEELIEMYEYKNNGTPHSKSQKSTVKISRELLDKLYETLDNDFWKVTANITRGQLKKDEDRDVLLQSLVLLSKFDFSSFKNDVIYGPFTDWLEGNNVDELFERLNVATNRLNELFPEKVKMMRKLSIPMVIYGMDKTIRNKKSTQKYGEWLEDFFTNYTTNDEYRQYCSGGTASRENVLGRRDYFRAAVNSLSTWTPELEDLPEEAEALEDLPVETEVSVSENDSIN
ncbi:MAG: DUF262 domain-containing protein [Clostridiales bacterium]|nr:DUF262 domain-containing protein [Clostridiales bacterium]